jgi:hypothetical protein
MVVDPAMLTNSLPERLRSAVSGRNLPRIGFASDMQRMADISASSSSRMADNGALVPPSPLKRKKSQDPFKFLPRAMTPGIQGAGPPRFSHQQDAPLTRRLSEPGVLLTRHASSAVALAAAAAAGGGGGIRRQAGVPRHVQEQNDLLQPLLALGELMESREDSGDGGIIDIAQQAAGTTPRAYNK